MDIKIVTNKKGLSSMFLAVFLVIIIIVLTTSLFTSITVTSNSSLQLLEQEKEKQQEAIYLQPGCIAYSGGIIQHITVNNTGSIPVKITSVYINSTFIENPQTLIKPQSSAQISLSDHHLSYEQNLFKSLTITTERGTKYSSYLKDLENPNISALDTIYGPIRLIFENFQWANFQPQFNNNYLDTANWADGWKANPGTYVIWRMVIQNMDVKTITLGAKSCFVLRSPDFGQSPPVFYIDSQCSDLVIHPREYASLYFVWQQPNPSSRDQNTASRVPQSVDTACISFLALQGTIGDRPLGETIPFEAVFIGN